MKTQATQSTPARRRGWRAPGLRTAGALALAALALVWQHTARPAEPAVALPAPAHDEPAGAAHTETAVLAGGCFWGMQGVFEHVRGVRRVVAGYAGGVAETAHYELVSDGGTGHAESIRVDYDPAQISYGRLLQVFFSVAHNPTQLDYQGPDHGTQYRSAIFPTTPAQRAVASAYVAQLGAARVFGAPIVTRIENYKGFYPAEAYHQDYLAQHPDAPYIAFNDLPKIGALKQMFPTLYRADPVLLTGAGN